ncbi:MAG: restriction endonuclease [Bacteroidota bacterium]
MNYDFKLDSSLQKILSSYRDSFARKTYERPVAYVDLLMDLFGIDDHRKSENSQYWGRELGKCWEKLVVVLFRLSAVDFTPSIKEGRSELADFCSGSDAIDTKYRIGSGDAGTLKKFASNAEKLTALGYRPVLLILRTDNLAAAISKCRSGGWDIRVGEETFVYIHQNTGFDLQRWMQRVSLDNSFKLDL